MRRIFARYYQSERGDTIVEVIIAIAVISSVLTGAFYLTNHSTRAVRDAEEHSQALQLLQGQVEQLRAQAPVTTLSGFPNYFCFKPDGTIQARSGANDYGCNSSNFYNFVIIRPASVPAGENGLFTLKVQWDSILSNKANESLLYKVPLKS